MPALPRDPAHASPSLGDYGTALWRHKAVVIAALLVGILAGVFALPRLASAPEYQVTQRVDVRATTADRLYGSQSLFGQNKSKATAGSVQTQGTPLDPSLVPDITALEQVLTKPGNQFKQLEVVNGIKPSLWLGTVAKSLVAVAVPGTTQIDVSFTDPDPQLAAELVGGYVRAYAERRNAADVAITRQAMTKLQGLYNDAYSRVSSLGRQAQTEASRSPVHAASQTTQAQLDAAKSNLNDLANQIAQVTSAQSFQGASTVVLGEPTVTQPGRKPGRVLFTTTGLLLGLLIGVAIALMVDALRPILVTPEDVEQATGLRVVGAVPIASRRADALAVRDRPLSPTAEGFHRVLASLERQGMARSNKVVAVLSGDKGEGRSTVAASLALSLARQGKSVVLVSADLRGGGVEKLFGISSSAAGLAELLESITTSHGEDIDVLLSRSFWSIGSGLFVLPPGQATTSPSELLASRSFHDVLASLRKDGTVVIVDVPPARWSADALLVAGAADMNILVVRSGVTRRQAAAELVDGLRAEDLTPASAVLLTKRPIAGRWWRYGRASDAAGGILRDTEPHPAIISTGTENGHDGRQRGSKRLDV
jgi:Mrp family chromosome partitioning ATPase/capsular polysaccharide biosynthesis protein